MAKAPVIGLFGWKCLQIGKYYLFAHPDLDINGSEGAKKSIVVIGNIYDSAEPQKGYSDIVKDIMARAYSVEGLVSWMKRYVGRYAVLYKDDKDVLILPDALALREIYGSIRISQHCLFDAVRLSWLRAFVFTFHAWLRPTFERSIGKNNESVNRGA